MVGSPPPAGVPVDDDADWSTFRHDPQRDSSDSLEATLAASNISQITREWNFAAGYAVEGSPAVVGGRVYFGAWNGYEYALNASNGTMLWRTYLGVTTGTCTYAPEVGITSSAALVNGTLFVGGGDSYWYALNASNGTILGRVFVGGNGPSGGNYNWASPLIVGQYAYIGVASECDNPLVRGGLLMVNISDPANLSNASVVHSFYTVPSGYVGNSIWASPSYDPLTDSVFVATGNPGTYTGSYSQAVIALNATDLAVRSSWQVLNTPNGDSDFSAGPMVFYAANGTPLVVAVNKDGLDYAFNASAISDGPVWSRAVSDPRSGYGPPAFNGSTLFLSGGAVTVGGVVHPGSVVAITPANATLWVHYTPGFILGGATYADGLVFVASDQETADGAGTFLNTTLEVLSSADGAVLANVTFPEEGVNSTLTVSDGRLFVGYANQTLDRGGGVVAFGLPLSVDATATSSGNSNGTFQFQADVSGGSPSYSFRWSFGDGVTASEPAPVHTYAASGAYEVGLEVRDTYGSVANWSTNLTVNITVAPLTATLTVTPSRGIAPLTTQLAIVPAGGMPPYSVLWTFGDGAIAVGATSESHTYYGPGRYTVQAEVQDSTNSSVTRSQMVDVAAPLGATLLAIPAQGVTPLTVNVSATITGGFGPFRYAWDFGDGGAVAQDQNATHTYDEPGNYTIALVVNDSAGDQTTASTLVAAVPATLQVALSSAGLLKCDGAGGSAVFTATVSGGLPPYSYQWEFGDGNSSVAGAQVTNEYATWFRGNASLTVRDAFGDQANTTAPVLWSTPSCPPALPPSRAFSITTETLEWLTGGIAAGGIGFLAVLILRRSRPRRPSGGATMPSAREDPAGDHDPGGGRSRHRVRAGLRRPSRFLPPS